MYRGLFSWFVKIIFFKGFVMLFYLEPYMTLMEDTWQHLRNKPYYTVIVRLYIWQCVRLSDRSLVFAR